MDTLKLGLFGAGRIGRVHAENIVRRIPQGELKTVVDPAITEEGMEYFRNLGVGLIEHDPGKIFGDPDIGGVVICSPTTSHAELIAGAAKAGKHIFCEKPIHVDVDTIREILGVVDREGVKFQVGFNRRFDHNYRAMHDAIASGRIGIPQIINLTSRDPAPPPLEFLRNSGGIFLDLGVHEFDLIRYLSGCEVESVYATGSVLVDPEIASVGDVDTAIVNMKLTSGALASVDLSRGACYGYDQRGEVLGSLGSVHTRNDIGSTLSVGTPTGVLSEGPLYSFVERYRDSFVAEVTSFIEAITGGRPTEVPGVYGIPPVQVALAADRSLRTGRPVKVDY